MFGQLAMAAATMAAAAYSVQVAKGALYSTGTSAPTPAQVNSDLWEVFRVFYNGLVSASKDVADWPEGSTRSPNTPLLAASKPSAN